MTVGTYLAVPMLPRHRVTGDRRAQPESIGPRLDLGR
jgi:hypothetical protein